MSNLFSTSIYVLYAEIYLIVTKNEEKIYELLSNHVKQNK